MEGCVTSRGPSGLLILDNSTVVLDVMAMMARSVRTNRKSTLCSVRMQRGVELTSDTTCRLLSSCNSTDPAPAAKMLAGGAVPESAGEVALSPTQAPKSESPALRPPDPPALLKRRDEPLFLIYQKALQPPHQ